MVIFITTATLYLLGMHLQMNRSLKRKLPKDATSVLILGATLRSQEVSPVLKSRLKKGAELLDENKDLKVIVTGGKGSEALPAESILMKKVLVDEYHIDEANIIIEDQARNTFENLSNSKPLLPKGRVVIITNEFHSVRVSLLARRLKMKYVVIGAKSPSYKRYKWELREQVAIFKSFFFDRLP